MSSDKVFPNYEKEINALIKELVVAKKIKGKKDQGKKDQGKKDTELLFALYKIHFEELVSENKYEWVEKVKGNFSKMKSGQGRTFPADYIIAIEKLAERSFWDIINPVPKEKKEIFRPCGIRYAAFCDEPTLYRELYRTSDVDDSNRVIRNYDEYGKTIIDYIIEYQAREGLRFLIEETEYGPFFIYRSEERSDEIWQMLLRMDEPALFEKLLKRVALDNPHLLARIPKVGSSFFEELSKTKNIFTCLCAPQSEADTDREIRYLSVLLYHLFMYAIKKEDMELAEKILAEYENFIEEELKRVSQEMDRERGDDFCINASNPDMHHICLGEQTLLIVWAFSENKDMSEKLQARIQALAPQSLIDRLNQKDISQMTEGEVRYDREHNICYQKCRRDEGIEVLELMAAENFKGVPQYYGEELGVHKIELFWPHRYLRAGGDKLKNVIELLNNIHRLSQNKLGKGLVYLHGEKIASNLHRRDDELVLTEWRNCKIGDPIEDIVTAVLELSTICECEDRDESALQNIIDALSVYDDCHVIENFGDKLIAEIDRRLPQTDQKRRLRFSAYEHLYFARCFADMHRAALNNIVLKEKWGSNHEK